MIHRGNYFMQNTLKNIHKWKGNLKEKFVENVIYF